ncbi:TolC family protein [Desulfobulbus alkaliphilus]|uniref:TolC family protein n=1 Tax=Desulfobulbus alkaliphilus TaxID=869814 RepID=UPI001962F873|nr:TolC family protein [Desulfobulbus alkaliphilus]MBM9538181.1 TolC family protein [Desulfobulbus alkaliphilus]
MKRLLAALTMLLCCLTTTGQAEEETLAAAALAEVELLDLHTAQRLALAENPDIAAARTRIEQARARVRQASAAWRPSLDLSGSGTWQRLADARYEDNKALAALMGGSADRTTDTYAAGLQATWVLFDGFFRTFKDREVSYGAQSADERLLDTRRLLVASVATAYLNTQLAQANIDIARADEAFYLRQLEDAQHRYEVGAGRWGDVLNFRIQLNSARNDLIRFQRELEAAGYGLAALMGLPDARLPAHVRLEPLDQEQQIRVSELGEDPAPLILEALAIRPDIRSLELAIKQAEAVTGQTKAPLYPNLELVGAVEGLREGDTGLTSDDFGSLVGVRLRWNLYSGGADTARRVESEQVKREAAYTLAGLRHAVAAEIQQDLALLASAREQVHLQRETVELVQQNRDLAESEFEAGEASLVRLNEAQRDLNTTLGRLALSLVAYNLAEQQLLAATGRNLDAFPPAARE